MEVTLTLASGAETQVVKNMFPGYFFDLSQYDPNLIINEYGVPMWAPFGLPGPKTLAECADFNWWIRDECELYVIRADGNPAGFTIILTDATHLAPEVDVELLDFYIVPKYRRLGIGRLAARAAFETHHGRWQVFQLEKNAPAITFWHLVIAEYTGGNYESIDEGTQELFTN
jgi:predicted acetyltransferase